MVGDDEFTVSLNLSSELLSWFMKAATMLTDGTWTCQDEAELDQKLAPLFGVRSIHVYPPPSRRLFTMMLRQSCS